MPKKKRGSPQAGSSQSGAASQAHDPKKTRDVCDAISEFQDSHPFQLLMASKKVKPVDVSAAYNCNQICARFQMRVAGGYARPPAEKMMLTPLAAVGFFLARLFAQNNQVNELIERYYKPLVAKGADVNYYGELYFGGQNHLSTAFADLILLIDSLQRSPSGNAEQIARRLLPVVDWFLQQNANPNPMLHNGESLLDFIIINFNETSVNIEMLAMLRSKLETMPNASTGRTLTTEAQIRQKQHFITALTSGAQVSITPGRETETVFHKVWKSDLEGLKQIHAYDSHACKQFNTDEFFDIAMLAAFCGNLMVFNWVIEQFNIDPKSAVVRFERSGLEASYFDIAYALNHQVLIMWGEKAYSATRPDDRVIQSIINHFINTILKYGADWVFERLLSFIGPNYIIHDVTGVPKTCILLHVLAAKDKPLHLERLLKCPDLDLSISGQKDINILEVAIFDLNCDVATIEKLLKLHPNPAQWMASCLAPILSNLFSIHDLTRRHALMELLCRYGADVNQLGMNQDKTVSNSPALIAIAENDRMSLEILKRHGADLEYSDTKTLLPLSMAIEKCKVGGIKVDVLLQNPFNLRVTTMDEHFNAPVIFHAATILPLKSFKAFYTRLQAEMKSVTPEEVDALNTRNWYSFLSCALINPDNRVWGFLINQGFSQYSFHPSLERFPLGWVLVSERFAGKLEYLLNETMYLTNFEDPLQHLQQLLDHANNLGMHSLAQMISVKRHSLEQVSTGVALAEAEHQLNAEPPVDARTTVQATPDVSYPSSSSMSGRKYLLGAGYSVEEIRALREITATSEDVSRTLRAPKIKLNISWLDEAITVKDDVLPQGHFSKVTNSPRHFFYCPDNIWVEMSEEYQRKTEEAVKGNTIKLCGKQNATGLKDLKSSDLCIQLVINGKAMNANISHEFKLFGDSEHKHRLYCVQMPSECGRYQLIMAVRFARSLHGRQWAKGQSCEVQLPLITRQASKAPNI